MGFCPRELYPEGIYGPGFISGIEIKKRTLKEITAWREIKRFCKRRMFYSVENVASWRLVLACILHIYSSKRSTKRGEKKHFDVMLALFMSKNY